MYVMSLLIGCVRNILILSIRIELKNITIAYRTNARITI